MNFLINPPYTAEALFKYFYSHPIFGSTIYSFTEDKHTLETNLEYNIILEDARRWMQTYTAEDSVDVYHNSYHCRVTSLIAGLLCVADKQDEKTTYKAMIAGMLHDCGHPGNPDDDFNVNTSIVLADQFLSSQRYSDSLLDENDRMDILEAIECTYFNSDTKKFPRHPKSIVGEYLRDADIAGFLRPQCWMILAPKLSMEMKYQIQTLQDVIKFIRDHIDFIRKCTFFRLKQNHVKNYIFACESLIELWERGIISCQS